MRKYRGSGPCVLFVPALILGLGWLFPSPIAGADTGKDLQALTKVLKEGGGTDREAALKAASEEVLLEGLNAVPLETRPAIMKALADRQVHEAIPLMIDLARREPTLIWDAIDALARMGVAPTQVAPRSPAFTKTERARYAEAALTAAGVLAERGEKDKAAAIYAAFTDVQTPPERVCRALRALADLGSPRVPDLALGYLHHPAVHEAAVDALIAVQAPEVDRRLERADAVLPPAARATLLAVRVKRQPEKAKALLDKAAADPEAVVRVQAALLRDETPPLAALIEAAGALPPTVRDGGFEAALDKARQEAAAHPEQAGPALEALVRGKGRTEMRRMALAELLALRLDGVNALLEDLLTDKALAETAGAAYLERVPPGEAGTEKLAGLLETLPAASPVARKAAERLMAQGYALDKLARRGGFLCQWLVAGPFGGGLDLFGPDAAAVNPTAIRQPVVHEGTPYPWRPLDTQGYPPVVHVKGLKGAGPVLLAAPIVSDTAQAVRFVVDTAFDGQLWLNGQPCPPRRDRDGNEAAGLLNQGENVLVVHVLEVRRAPPFSVRVRDTDGRPAAFHQPQEEKSE